MRSATVFLLAVPFCAFGTVIYQTGSSDIVTASATYETDSSGTPVALDAWDFPTDEFTVVIPDLPYTPGDAIMFLSFGAGYGDWHYTLSGSYSPTSGIGGSSISAATGASDWSIPYEGGGTLDLTWSPFFYINPDDPSPPVSGPITTSADLQMIVTAAINTDSVPEPTTLVPIALAGALFLYRRTSEKLPS